MLKEILGKEMYGYSFELITGPMSCGKTEEYEYILTENDESSNKDIEETQISFFTSIPDPVIEKIKALDLMNTTPSEALKVLEELKGYI